jgi:hypothetical protein
VYTGHEINLFSISELNILIIASRGTSAVRTQVRARFRGVKVRVRLGIGSVYIYSPSSYVCVSV